ncbi:uracil phosphoribosyltransferase homolog [Watersipora subatra]|uniref:uracil phosphoribosyltransferase homolog n=1 Tax=Watersipora subatra TaxID=2589382 RepID=UPI00355C378A
MEPDLIPNLSSVTICNGDSKPAPESASHIKPVNPESKTEILEPCSNNFSKEVKVTRQTDQMRALQTNLRDINTSRSDFIFCADRLIRMVVEEALAHLPYDEVTVTTPTGAKYAGKKFKKGVTCGVSIMRSGEAMEQGLRDCCRSIRIGKILIQTDSETGQAKVFYAKFPSDVVQRQVLLLYPILSSGNTVSKALEVLQEHGVDVKNVLLVSLFCTPYSLELLRKDYPELRILTTEIHPIAPSHFGQRYFGTE